MKSTPKAAAPHAAEMPAAESAVAEAASVGSAKTTMKSAASMTTPLGAERDREEQSERRDDHQATHTRTLYGQNVPGQGK